jgi:hypothetical protein
MPTDNSTPPVTLAVVQQGMALPGSISFDGAVLSARFAVQTT